MYFLQPIFEVKTDGYSNVDQQALFLSHEKVLIDGDLRAFMVLDFNSKHRIHSVEVVGHPPPRILREGVPGTPLVLSWCAAIASPASLTCPQKGYHSLS